MKLTAALGALLIATAGCGDAQRAQEPISVAVQRGRSEQTFLYPTAFGSMAPRLESTTIVDKGDSLELHGELEKYGKVRLLLTEQRAPRSLDATSEQIKAEHGEASLAILERTIPLTRDQIEYLQNARSGDEPLQILERTSDIGRLGVDLAVGSEGGISVVVKFTVQDGMPMSMGFGAPCPQCDGGLRSAMKLKAGSSAVVIAVVPERGSPVDQLSCAGEAVDAESIEAFHVGALGGAVAVLVLDTQVAGAGHYVPATFDGRGTCLPIPSVFREDDA